MMETAQLIDAMSRPDAYPHPVGEVVVRQTHISAVFLAGEYAYKIKKAVDFGFLDFSTLERRKLDCEEEVRLNRRLAPDVYLGVVPVNRSGASVAIEGPGETVEWAVKMERLPDDATLWRRIERGEAGEPEIIAVARRIATFHRQADAGSVIADAARFGPVSKNAEDNFSQSEPLVGATVSRAVFDRLRDLTTAWLDRLRPLIESRADRGVPRDTHGDLRLEHIYVRPDRDPPSDLVIIDCIEFNNRLRHADPVADVAFLIMDLRAHGRRDLSEILFNTYVDATNDEEGHSLLPFYVSYRAAVRGKVEGLAMTEAELSEDDRIEAMVEARGHWLLALDALETPDRRPGLVLVGGLPGVGKSTLARGLADRAGFEVVRSDLVRKELAGHGSESSAASGFEEGIYTPEWTERTYAECLRRADAMLFEGRRVVVDASFGREAHRSRFLHLADRRCVPGVMLLCQAVEVTVQDRLSSRSGDVSDADLAIYRAAAERWEHAAPETQSRTHILSTDQTIDASIDAAIAMLRREDLIS